MWLEGVLQFLFKYVLSCCKLNGAWDFKKKLMELVNYDSPFHRLDSVPSLDHALAWPPDTLIWKFSDFKIEYHNILKIY